MKKKFATLLAIVMLIMSFAVVPAQADTVASGKTNLFEATKGNLTNIDLAIEQLNGVYVDYCDYFSFNDTIGPRTEKEGYKSAINGRGTKAIGGGVSQVASTLYLALKKLDGIEYDEKRTYGDKYTQSYVSDADDAIITDYINDIDFSFTNYYGGFYITLWRDDNYVYCSLDNYDDYDYDDDYDFDFDFGDDDDDDYDFDFDFGDDDEDDDDGGFSFPWIFGGDDDDDDEYYDDDDDEGSFHHVLGYAAIDLNGTSALKNNIKLAANSINGYAMGHNDVFSFNDIVGPRTEKYGYQTALNGRGVKVVGGGVAQVASAIWLAVDSLDDIRILERHTYGSKYNQDYVYDEDDAIMTDYNGKLDFSFRYSGYDTLVIATYITSDGEQLVCEIAEE